MSTLNWKAVRNRMGIAVGIQAGDFMVVKEHMFGEDQYIVTNGKKLVTVANEPDAAKAACERDPLSEAIPEVDFPTHCDMQSGGAK